MAASYNIQPAKSGAPSGFGAVVNQYVKDGHPPGSFCPPNGCAKANGGSFGQAVSSVTGGSEALKRLESYTID